MNRNILFVIFCALATFALCGCTIILTDSQACRETVMVKYEEDGSIKYVPEERIVDCNYLK